MSEQYPNGSQWRRWDLHVHTPASHEHQFEGWDQYVNELEQVRDIAVIGVTDYFTVDGYKKVLGYRANGRLKNFALVLPNIELRLDTLVSRRGNSARRLNFHVIFSNEVSVEDIETQFLHTLEIAVEGSPGKPGDRRVLTRSSIEEVGRSVKSFQKSAVARRDFAAGCDSITVKLDDVTKALQKKCFDGKYLLVLPTSDWDQIDWGQDYLTRKLLLQTAHAVFCGQESTINWCLGRGDTGPEQFAREFGRLKPSIHGSDAHCVESLCKPDNGKSCWIKADPTFEGLKQIVYEPEVRVAVQKEDPAESETYAKIGPLRVEFPHDLAILDEAGDKTDFCLNGAYSLEFSNNLTCIIGGRGSGKSTIAHVVYNSSMNRTLEKLSAINSPLLSLDMGPNPAKRIAECTTCDVPSKTEFFFQNEIEHIAKNIESMSDLIRHRLDNLSLVDGGPSLDGLREIWATSMDSIDKLVDAYDRITDIDLQISQSQENINTLRRQTEIIKSDDYKAFQSRISDLSANIADYQSYQTDYERIYRGIDSLVASITELKWSAEQGGETLKAVQHDLEGSRKRLQTEFETFAASHDQQDFPGQLRQAQEDLRQYLGARGLSPENIQELAEANTKIRELEEQIREWQLARKPYGELYDIKSKTIDDYRLAYQTYRDRFLRVGSSLQQRLAGLAISAREVKLDLAVDYTQLKSSLVDFVKESLEHETRLRSDAIEGLLFNGADIDGYILDKNLIRDRFNQSTKGHKHRQMMQELINDDVFLERLYLRMLQHFFAIQNIHIQTKLGGKLLKNTSFGERCGIVIAIVLVAGTNPIVVDQPDDHLDGKFISDVLVPLVRKQKRNRQIVLITRDANIVVGGDAELIHILEPTDQRTEVLASSIEDAASREKYIWILDGGTEAFYMREQKYNIGLLKARIQGSGS